MHKKDVLDYFKTGTRVQQVLKLKSTGTVSQWGPIIPEKQAMRLERLTNGALRYDPACYDKKPDREK